MSRLPRHNPRLVWLLIVMLLGAAAWSHGRYVQAKNAAQAATADLLESQALAQRVEKLTERAPVALAGELQISALAGAIEQAASTAQLPIAGVLRINPQAPRRVGDTPYLQKPTDVSLRSVTLQQLIGFLHALSADRSNLWPTELSLSAPRAVAASPSARGPGAGPAEQSDRWDADLTLSYLIYSPPAARTRGGNQP